MELLRQEWVVNGQLSFDLDGDVLQAVSDLHRKKETVPKGYDEL